LGKSRLTRAPRFLILHRSIHERSAREKISSDQVAHVLNDEVSRKYIQSVKRYASNYFGRSIVYSGCHEQAIDVPSNQIPSGGYLAANGLTAFAEKTASMAMVTEVDAGGDTSTPTRRRHEAIQHKAMEIPTMLLRLEGLSRAKPRLPSFGSRPL
jgi:hypothetical protein